MPLERGIAGTTAKHPRASLRWDCSSTDSATGGKEGFLQEIKAQNPKGQGTKLRVSVAMEFSRLPLCFPSFVSLAAKVLKKLPLAAVS